MFKRRKSPDTDQLETENDIASLISAVRQDPKAFGQLYLRYVQPVYRYLYNRIGNAIEAEDVTAQTFLAVMEGLARYRHNDHFDSWLFSIACHKSMDHFRRQRHQAALEEARPESGSDSVEAKETDPLQQVIQTEQQAALARLIRSLPPDKQELLRLRFVAELSFEEIDILLQQKEDTVKKTLYRLLAQLHEQALSLDCREKNLPRVVYAKVKVLHDRAIYHRRI